jgi:hypothetical protein
MGTLSLLRKDPKRAKNAPSADAVMLTRMSMDAEAVGIRVPDKKRW